MLGGSGGGAALRRMRKDQSVLSARKAALTMGLTECIERAAPPQALLSLPGSD
jgi:hypothetical protein